MNKQKPRYRLPSLEKAREIAARNHQYMMTDNEHDLDLHEERRVAADQLRQLLHLKPDVIYL